MLIYSFSIYIYNEFVMLEKDNTILSQELKKFWVFFDIMAFRITDNRYKIYQYSIVRTDRW